MEWCLNPEAEWIRMSPIVTDVERPSSHSTPRLARSGRLLRRVLIPVMTVVTVCSSTVVVITRPVSADTVAGARAKAAEIESELSAAQAEMSTLSQQYDQARYKLSQVNASIATTKAAIAVNESRVAKDKTTLEKAAIANYVSDGSATTDNPIFSNNEKTLGAASEYNQIASGDINQAVANLHTAENKLAAQQAQLTTQQGEAQNEVNAEQEAVTQNQQVVQSESAALSQENGEIEVLVQQQAQAAAAVAQRQAAAQVASAQSSASSGSGSSGDGFTSTAAPPPTAAGGEGAVEAAESQLGVPYVWGGESPKGSADPGFDCSGLTAWSWGQVGVSLPHYSGAQEADSTPISIGDLEPGDLIFYGPGGSEHVAMYVSPGTMIEAPETGQVVHLTALRVGSGYGRP
jgi:peptidoglycan DL-endopeptidase CwlO